MIDCTYITLGAVLCQVDTYISFIEHKGNGREPIHLFNTIIF